MRTKSKQNKKPLANFRAIRGVERHILFDCMGNIRPQDFEELTATHGENWTEDDLSKQWTDGQVDGLTLFADNVVAGCIVAWEAAPGHWTCGMVANRNFMAIGFIASRYLKRYLRPILMGQRVRRLSCIVDASYDQAIRWLHFLGFECEGRLHQYGVDGRDFLMMAMLPKRNQLRKLEKMCSPQQAVGTQNLAQEMEDLRMHSDMKIQRQMWRRAKSIEAAERHARNKEREALVRAGKRFGRTQTIGQQAARDAALNGTVGQA